MTYGQLKTRVMQLIFSESIAGDVIESTYNNQADYLRAIPGLVNDAQVYIATTVKRIPAVRKLTDLPSTDLGVGIMYNLPSSCWRMMNGGLMHPVQNGSEIDFERFHGYKLMKGGRQIVIPKNVPHQEEMLVEYYRFPAQLEDNTDDDTALDNTLEVQSAIPYYVAAHLVMYDDAFRYASLWNEFETRLGRITEPITTEYARMDDAYGGFEIPGA